MALLEITFLNLNISSICFFGEKSSSVAITIVVAIVVTIVTIESKAKIE